jgi:hypothetical protein
MINFKYILNNSRLLGVLPVLVLQFCTSDTSSLAGGTEIGNPVVVTGCILRSDGSPAPHTQVFIIPVDYTPSINSKPTDFLVDTTDAAGAYTFRLPAGGLYNIQADNFTSRDRLLIYNIVCRDSSVKIPSVSLTKPGFVQLFPSDDSTQKAGYYYIPGTRYFITSTSNTPCIIDSVPTGTIPSIAFASIDSASKSTIRYNTKVVSGDTAKVFNLKWKYSRKCVLNTSVTGANVLSDLTGFPVLIRLAYGNFDFSQTQAKGEDIRFTKADGTPMFFEIERWDTTLQSAAIWVKVDTVYGNDTSHFINMYWGNSAAVSASNSAMVFDTSIGFQGVWHLGEAGNSPALDASFNKFNGTSYGMTDAAAVRGITGGALHFDGSSSYIQMKNTALSKLNFKQNDVFSISAWVNLDTITSENQMVAGKGILQYYLKCKPPLLGYCYEFAEYYDKDGWYTTTSDTIKTAAKTWAYMVGIREGTKQSFYLNGKLVGSTLYKTANTLSRDESEDFSIGRYLKEAVSPNPPEGFCYFYGIIDEVRIMNTAPGADWVRLCYMNQKEIDALVKW